MAGFHHGPAQPAEPHDAPAAARRAGHGLILFFIYLAFYAGFMVLNAFRPDLMESTPVAGINLAILYGLGLIVGAFVLALVYAWLCLDKPAATAAPSQQTGGRP